MESVLLYGAEAWTTTESLSQRIETAAIGDSYSRPMAGHTKKDHVPNSALYKITHACLPVADLVFWRADGPYKSGQGSRATYGSTCM